jgi:flagellar hook-associated protein 2
MAFAGAIDGIISGLDTTKIIDTMMKMDQRQVDLYTERQTNQTNKLTSWKSIEALLVAFKTQATLLSDDKLWYAKSVTSSDEDILTASAATNASPGNYLFTVSQLATNHQLASQGFNLVTQNIGNGTVTIKLGNGTPAVINIDSSNNTLTGLKDAINNSNCGVTAAIINDGSYSNPYRLILTAKESGASNQISFTSNLSGGTAPNFATPQFDLAEKISWNGSATSNPVLSTSASYTGATNKTYTFTMGGTGLQTVGSGAITVNWTDGTNSGSFEVTGADSDVQLTGQGGDGLSLHFSAGTLQAGDTFQIQAFAPTIQKAQDAIIQLGGSQSGGSAITVSSATNTITNLIQGVTLNLKSTTTSGQQIKVTVATDNSRIKDQIRNFVAKFNEYQSFVDKQFSFIEGGEAGVLLGDGSLLIMHNEIRSTISRVFDGRSSQMRMLSQAGVKFDSDGKLKFDESIFGEKAKTSIADMVKLFKSNGTSDKAFIEYVSSTAFTKVTTTGYKVDITRAAARGSFKGVSITNPSTSNLVIDSTNNSLKIKINNSVSGLISLAPQIYTSGNELAQDIENAINADANLSALGVNVEWIDNGNSGNLMIYTKAYGSKESVTIENDVEATGHAILGLTGGMAQAGQDVEGTINGEKAKGEGQILTGDHSNTYTADLKLKITATPDQIISGAEGTILFNKGVAALVDEKLSRYTDYYTGMIKTKSDSLQKTVDNIAKQIDELQKQQERKRASLYKQFQAMEEALAKMQSQQQYLAAAIAGATQITTQTTSKQSS